MGNCCHLYGKVTKEGKRVVGRAVLSWKCCPFDKFYELLSDWNHRRLTGGFTDELQEALFSKFST